MLEIDVPKLDFWDEVSGEFIVVNAQRLQLEHSLISVSKWESFWCKPFLSPDKKTDEETLSYIRFMTINKSVNPLVFMNLGNDNIQRINEYVSSKRTATTFYEPGQQPAAASRKIITSEMIYSWMVAYNIPMECEKWFLNRLITLIKIIQIENKPKKKTNLKSLAARNRALNAARRKELGTNG